MREIDELRSFYIKAQIRLIRIIAEQQARGNVTVFRQRLLDKINAEIRRLDEFATGWVDTNVSIYYERGTRSVESFFNRVNMDTGEISIRPERVQIIKANVLGKFTDAHQFVGRVLQDEIRQAGIEAIAEKITSGDTVRQAKKNLVQKMTDRGIVAIRDKRGREISLDAYAQMVARTTSREVQNTALVDQLGYMNRDLVQMSSHNSPCEICAPLEGRIYSISGTSPDYPALDTAFSSGFQTIHPNCRHVITPYIPRLDPNREKNKAQSNRPFDTDPRSQRERKKYEESQRKNTRLRNDRDQFERYKLNMPDKTPSTFSAFRRIKNSNSEKFQELESEYRSIRS